MVFYKQDEPYLHFYKGANVLVTGASGFIGKQLCNDLLSLGALVHGFTRQPQTTRKFDPRVIWHQVFMDDVEKTRDVVDRIRPQYVFHLAGLANAAREMKMIVPTFTTNLQSTVNLLTALIPHQCRRVVLAGSLEEPDDDQLGESPSSPYAASKTAQTIYARMFQSVYNVQISLTRIFMVYGPGQSDMKKLVPYVIQSTLQGKPASLSAGIRLVDWVHVSDVSQCLIHTAVSNEAVGRRIDIGTGELTLVRDVALMAGELIDPNIKHIFGALPPRFDEQIRKADPELTYKFIAYRPKIKLRDGLIDTINYYKKIIVPAVGIALSAL